ncbi:DTW domain-containing protein YfiP, partial [Bienertia sinuspersici]
MNPSHRITSRSRSKSYGSIITSLSRSTRSYSLPSPRKDPIDGTLTLQEWQNWGTNSPVPASIIDAIAYLKAFERESDAQMIFGGNGGRLIGEYKIKEDKKHRVAYQALGDSEMKLQFFSARQIACRLLGSRGYLCQKCWLPYEDCMCLKVKPCPLWRGIRFWLYMHPKDFLRQNNTGKVLWQVFGVEAATLCLFGIVEHEETMWNEFKKA